MKKTISILCFILMTFTGLFAQLMVDCDETYTIPSTTYAGDVTAAVSDSMVSSAIHTNNSTVVYTAANSILCVGDFEIELGTTFCADITSCVAPCIINGMHAAWDEFVQRGTSVMYSGTNVVIQTDGLPDHTSPYWSNTTERCTTTPMGQQLCTNSNTTVDHPLFVAPTVTNFNTMAPGNIDDFNGSYTLTVPQSPALATNSSSTGLGAIGFAVSGSVIYNDEEGPNVPLDNAIGSLDYTAAHTGPQSYHYHLEPHAWSQDDDELIGVISDGFFLYGRKCASTGTYPTDLDASGGHTTMTQHSCNPEYHYHIKNELYLNQYYILFPGDYQGTPNNIQ